MELDQSIILLLAKSKKKPNSVYMVFPYNEKIFFLINSTMLFYNPGLQCLYGFSIFRMNEVISTHSDSYNRFQLGFGAIRGNFGVYFPPPLKMPNTRDFLQT
jgi:hypothetical protein